MQARIVPARQGAAWLVDGWRLFRAAPLGWLAMVFAYWIIMTLASVVPFIGVAAASIMVPAFSVGFMAAARAASRRGRSSSVCCSTVSGTSRKASSSLA
jgi:hypothetical protein